MGKKNPLDSVRFFEHYDDTESFTMSKETINSMMPQNFQVIAVQKFSGNCSKEQVR